MASTGQTGPQAPQSIHSSGQMMCSPLRSPVIASVGHRFTHAVQPMQVSMMRNAMGGLLYRQSVEHPIDDRSLTRTPTRCDPRPHRGGGRVTPCRMTCQRPDVYWLVYGRLYKKTA